LRKFHADDNFCANVHFSGKRGLRISSDGKDAALGKADSKYDYSGETAESVCDDVRIDEARLSVVELEQWAEDDV